jgi:hypothetical protein
MGEPVKTDMELQLQARLAPALEDLVPGPAPLAAIIRDGRRVRVRRRISLTTGLAAAAVLVIAGSLTLPSLLSRTAVVPPLTTHYHVTVTPPGPKSPNGLIAAGTVNGVPWSVRAERESHGAYLFTGLNIYASTSIGNLPGRYARGDPLDGILGSLSQSAYQVEAVRADVVLVHVTLTDGQVLRLLPIAATGARNASLIAFAVPDYRDVVRIEAFGKHGEIGYTVPWTGHSWLYTGRWLKPDQPALPQPRTAVIGSGTAFGQSWRALVAVGPWGWCGNTEVGSRLGGGCFAGPPPLRRGQYYRAVGFAGGLLFGKSGEIEAAEVADTVVFVELTTRSGQHTWVRPHSVGGRWFVCFSSGTDLRAGSAPLTVVRWAAYDRRHHLLATGSAQRS